ncbi:MAG: GDP-mannose 4,6-dehydratase, partial [Thermodesulfovibrionia bacterium]|nr:GDP-mannose 4,6-dehydratase [Thermodesulfovibrionia bacterium]
MNVLITGITGFVASHLAEFLLNKNIGGLSLCGTKRWRSPTENIIGIKDKINLVDMELNDFLSVKDAIKETEPDIIFHLAAQSFIPAGFSQPSNTLEVNTFGTLNILEAVRLNDVDPIVHVCSTADVYGNFDKEGIIVDENSVPKPPNLYAVSKLAAEMLGIQYFQSYGIKSICSRIMNHTGPRRGPNFAESSFSIQIAEIEKGLKEKVIRVGNLGAVRTFMDVRDAVGAYWTLVNKCKPGECYNIAGDATMT